MAATLAADGLVHVYWATGATWPATDPKTLSMAVLNANVSFGPLNVGPLACLLFCGALMALARVNYLGKIGRRIPGFLLQWGILAFAAGFFLRFAVGVGWVLGLGAGSSTMFYRLNLMIYTPVCLVLFACAVAASRFGRSRRYILERLTK